MGKLTIQIKALHTSRILPIYLSDMKNMGKRILSDIYTKEAHYQKLLLIYPLTIQDSYAVFSI